MITLSVSELKKSFGETILFDNVSFSIQDKDKVSLIGVNGSGKTTLMNILTGRGQYDSGNIHFAKFTNIGYVQQHVDNESDLCAIEYVINAYEDIIKVEAQIEEVNQAILAENDQEKLISLTKQQAKLNDFFIENDGLVYRSKARSTLMNLGFNESMLDQPLKQLSGGEKSKVMLAKMLLSRANLLMLDEPTNHLDISAVNWLEEFLQNYNGAALIISHDRYFLDKVTNKTFELENKKVKIYNGNYSSFYEQKQKEQAIIEHHYRTQKREIDRIKEIVVQQRRWNRERNIRMAESKEKQIERLEQDLVVPDKEVEKVRFKFSPAKVSGNDVLMVKDLAKAFDNKQLFNNINFELKRNDKAFLIGANGCGKTTLLRILMGEIEKDKGEFEFGANVDKAYYDQTQLSLNADNTIIDEIWDAFPKLNQTQIRNALATFLFKGEDVFKKIGPLSGGEKARISIVKLMLKGANFLILDEPTNHLDIYTREVLERALLDYDGTMLIVSHDRYFINKLSTKIISLKKEGIELVYGNYDYYLSKQTISLEAAKAPKEKVLNKNEYVIQREKKNNQKKLVVKQKEIEREIKLVEQKIDELESQFNTEDYELLNKLTIEHSQLSSNLEDLFEQWEQISNEIENID